MKLGNLFEMSQPELEELFHDYIAHSRSTLWLAPNQESKICCKKGSDLILMFFQDSLILYCERVQKDLNDNDRELQKRFNEEIKNLPVNVHSRILSYDDFTELQLYRKEYLEWLEENT